MIIGPNPGIAITSGSLITILDAAVNAYGRTWSIFDASAGTNRKVYRCHMDALESGSGISGSIESGFGDYDFYLDCNDNQSQYGIIRICEGWDAGTHAAVGQVTTVVDWKQGAATTSYYIFINDHYLCYVVWTAATADTGVSCWAGVIDSLDPTKKTYLSIGATTGYYNTNSMAAGSVANEGIWYLLQGLDGSYNQRVATWGENTSATAINARRDYNDLWYIFPTVIVDNASPTGFCHGKVDTFSAVPGYAEAEIGLNTGDKITADGVDWLVVGDAVSTVFIKME